MMNDHLNNSPQSGGHEPLSGPSPWQSLGAQPPQNGSTEPPQSAAPAQQPPQGAQEPPQTATAQPDGNPPVPPQTPAQPLQSAAQEPPKKKKRGGRWLKPALAVLVAAAVVFGAGYGGVRIAYNGMERVVIREVASGTEGAAGAAGTATALTSEQVADKTVPSVVAIVTEEMTTNNFWFGSQVTSGAGSGVILSADGYILTNYHVVGTADTVKVELSDGTTHDAKLVGSYADGDLAVIKIEATGLTPVTFADSDSVRQGATVYAVGNPEGNFSDSITMGIISALDRTITVSQEDGSGGSNNYGDPFGGFFGQGQSSQRAVELKVFQFDAAVSPGNSGGGLFNANGELIGIVCAKSSDTSAEGLSFAILGNTAKKVAESIISTGSYTPDASDAPSSGQSGQTVNTNKAVLGITASTFTAEQAQQYGLSKAGVYIVSLQTQSAADAGLAVGDRIISIDGVIVEETTDVTGYLADKEPGDAVELSLERSGKQINCTVTLQSNSDAA